jgi:FKBP-type peptidyl-prolyl cis-trans isomerase SlyD
MKVAKDKAVTVDYTLSDEKGDVLETSRGRKPLTFVQGSGMIKGFEAALEGKSPKDAFSFTVKPEDGYGEHRKELIFEVPREQLNQVEGLEEGMPLRVHTPEGDMIVIVKEIRQDKVLLDGNHPLAGMPLTFDVEVLEVREATKEELEEIQSEPEECSGCGQGCEQDCKGH